MLTFELDEDEIRRACIQYVNNQVYGRKVNNAYIIKLGRNEWAVRVFYDARKDQKEE